MFEVCDLCNKYTVCYCKQPICSYVHVYLSNYTGKYIKCIKPANQKVYPKVSPKFLPSLVMVLCLKHRNLHESRT